MPLPPEHLLDELATAYVQAVAAVTGATIAVSRRDYGVDGTLKHIVKAADGRFIESGYPVDFQLKGTTTATQSAGRIGYDLKVRNYNLIVGREPLAAPYYLFLVCFPDNPQDWIVEAKERLILSASAYWWTETGQQSSNVSAIRINIPGEQQLCTKSLGDIFKAAGKRFAP